MTSDTSDRTVRLVASAYGVAIRPERFDELLQAWDDWFNHLSSGSEEALADVSNVFADALLQAEHLQVAAPDAWQDQSAVPAILLDEDGAFLTLNASAKNLFAEEGVDPVDALARRVPTSTTFGSGKHATFRLAGGPSNRSFLAVETPVSGAMRTENPQAKAALFLSLMDWNETFEQEVMQELDLSPAELRVSRGLFEGRTAQEIADDVGRSLPTIRSHIKSLLAKTGARRQIELVQFLMILRQVSYGAPSAKKIATGSSFESLDLSGAAGRLEVVRYGAGQPVLYFTTSSCPEESESVRDALRGAGFCIMSPVRPGFGNSDPVRGDASEALLDNWLDRLLALTGPAPLLAGHREGGIVAAKAAERMLVRGDKVEGLVLISTGAPVRDLTQFDTAPSSIRRSFIGAHVAAPAVRLGYKTAARLFNSSTIGQDKIIQFFHKDSPSDTGKLENTELREITRDLLSFCFQNPDQITRDVALWGSDWTPTLDRVADESPVLFVHGADHVFQKTEYIQEYATGKPRVSVSILPNVGQMALYEQPNVVAHAIEGFARQCGIPTKV